MIDVALPLGFGVEVDALYRHTGFRTGNGGFWGSFQARYRANTWEFPMLLKYRLPLPFVKPYAEVGYAPRHIAGSYTIVGYSVNIPTGTRTFGGAGGIQAGPAMEDSASGNLCSAVLLVEGTGLLVDEFPLPLPFQGGERIGHGFVPFRFRAQLLEARPAVCFHPAVVQGCGHGAARLAGMGAIAEAAVPGDGGDVVKDGIDAFGAQP